MSAENNETSQTEPKKSNLLELVAPDERRMAAVVEMAENLLTRAKTGEFKSLLVLVLDEEGYYKPYWTGVPSLPELLGQLELLKLQYIKSAFEEDNPL